MRLPRAVDQVLDAAIVPSFTSFGYQLRGLHPVTERMDGRRVLITGATSGLGRSAAGSLAGLGASVVIVGRNTAKTDATARAIASEHPKADIDVEIADLSLLAEVRELAARIRSGPSIDVLVNNAGSLFPERRETSEGIELTVATNLAGHFVLTNEIASTISTTGRVINVSSGGAYTQRISIAYLRGDRGYDGATMYAQTKRAQLILTELWSARLAPVVVHAMHPGWANTPGVEGSLPGFFRMMRPVLRTPSQGADTIVWLAASEEARASTGRFWLDRVPRPIHKLRRTRETVDQRHALWDYLTDLTT